MHRGAVTLAKEKRIDLVFIVSRSAFGERSDFNNPSAAVVLRWRKCAVREPRIMPQPPREGSEEEYRKVQRPAVEARSAFPKGNASEKDETDAQRQQLTHRDGRWQYRGEKASQRKPKGNNENYRMDAGRKGTHRTFNLSL